jgi:hypothetical protein
MWPHSVMTRLARGSTISRQMGHSSMGSGTTRDSILQFVDKNFAILNSSSVTVCKDIFGAG